METLTMECCGITELAGIAGLDPQRVVAGLVSSDQHPRHTGIVLFTGADSYQKQAEYAKGLVRYIKKHKLGKVSRSPLVRNRNTNRIITLYTWVTDLDALTKWAEKDENKGLSDRIPSCGIQGCGTCS